MIIATLADPRYSRLFRDHITKNSMWEWGIDEQYEFYFRDRSANSYMKDWSRLSMSQLYTDPETYNTMITWRDIQKKAG